LHFDDYGGRRADTAGMYSGFSIYVPDKQYSNANASLKIAESVFSRLSSSFKKSNLPKEDAGIVFDQDLIAVGSYNTLDSAAMLIEYAYIYEQVLHNPQSRPSVLQTYVQKTYEGVNNFFTSQEL
jgi:N-acetylmuramoyl-L-alanine amidase